MKKILFIALMFPASMVYSAEYLLFFLGGQSNMEGFGYNKELPEEYQNSIDDVMIFNGFAVPDDSSEGGYGQWLPLSPGFGTGYKADKTSYTLSERFGPELSFGKYIAKLTGKKIAIIKYARGGSSIALGASGYGTWAKDYQDNTTLNQWDYFNNTVELAMGVKDIDGDGEADTLTPAGIVWMQGEADAYNEAASKVYLQNLTQLMSDITAVFGSEELPIVLGKINDSGKTPETRVMPYIEPVWEAQRQYASSHNNVELVQFDHEIEFLEDKWHYKSKHYIELGKIFAAAMHGKLD
ncbi:sialate O-acetylesterase [Thalassotalea mangrovi]|nr:sialate O-acetylesterase [Thalassotalea mangrovi]